MNIESKYSQKLLKIQEKNAYLEQKYKLLSEQNEYKVKAKTPSTSKLILWAVILICVEIIFFSEFAMLKTGDTSALYALIGVPATLVPSILGYYHKAAKENCAGGVVYEATINNNDNLEGSNLMQEVNLNDGD